MHSVASERGGVHRTAPVCEKTFTHRIDHFIDGVWLAEYDLDRVRFWYGALKSLFVCGRDDPNQVLQRISFAQQAQDVTVRFVRARNVVDEGDRLVFFYEGEEVESTALNIR
jgi:hypothetical protein